MRAANVCSREINPRMRRTGNTLWLIVAALLLLAGRAHAALDASVDRQQVAMGDTLRLVIVATDDEDLNSIDLGPVQQDFDILQRSSSSSMSIVNGQRSQTRQLVLDITPRREGTLRIPPLSNGSASTRALTVSVGAAPELPGGDQQVLFEAEVDKPSVYVQGQVLLTLRVQQAINLDARSISELEVDNAFVKPLEQKSFQRTVGGRPWLVHEIRYAIFPEQSGTLEIPTQTFSARESLPRRSLFDRGQGKLIRRSTEPLRIEVLPRPENYPGGATWLPARDLQIEEQWSTPPEQLRAGQSTTRTVRITGTGLQGAQLPPTLFPSSPGLKYYPDQPQITETEISSGLVGQRVDSAALVPTQGGDYRIPEIRIRWWDTESGELREAFLPARDIHVAPAEFTGTAPPATPEVAATAPSAAPAPAATNATELWWWRGIAVLSAAGWLATLAWLFLLRGRRQNNTEPQPLRQGANENKAFKNLLAACAANNPGASRQALQDWLRALLPEHAGEPLEVLLGGLGDTEMLEHCRQLDARLYRGSDEGWEGSGLASAAQRLRKGGLSKQHKTDEALRLYPETAGWKREKGVVLDDNE